MTGFERGVSPGKCALALLVLLVCLSLVTPARAAADETDAVLSAGESLFKAMKQKDYTDIWMGLTQKSRKSIAEEVYKKTRGAGQAGYSVDTVEKDFSGGGPIAKEYWDAFLQNFNPDDALEQSEWEMGPVKKDAAEISLLHKNAEKPAHLKMLKESGQWKVGLVETFGNRK
jgi:hypothetical protein